MSADGSHTHLLWVALKPGNGDLQAEISNNVLKVKFDRPKISLSAGEAVLCVSGSLNTGEPFEGSTTIQVISPGK